MDEGAEKGQMCGVRRTERNNDAARQLRHFPKDNTRRTLKGEWKEVTRSLRFCSRDVECEPLFLKAPTTFMQAFLIERVAERRADGPAGPRPLQSRHSALHR